MTAKPLPADELMTLLKKAAAVARRVEAGRTTREEAWKELEALGSRRPRRLLSDIMRPKR
ncbi:MAG: hypothetical protein HS117_19260 [Verrucomicrobiaceae bacterium]|nr:hypothetical protein [Verrucomicrobiaceae bacterium]